MVLPTVILLLATVAWQTSGPAWPQSDQPDADVLRAVEQLSAKSFTERQRATDYLWAQGKRAEGRLLQALSSKDRETRLRAQSVLDRFRFGILTDTPPEAIAEIHRFRFGDSNSQHEAMRRLVQQGALETILALASQESRADRREEWARHAEEIVIKRAPELIVKGDYEQAEKLVRMGAINDDGMRHLATFLRLGGKIDDEIERLRRLEGAAANPRRVAFLCRAKGDLPAACAAAAAVSREFLRECLLEARDWQRLVQLPDDGDKATDDSQVRVEAMGYMAAFHRLAGNASAFQSQVAAIAAMAQEGSGLEWYCAEALLINGCVDEALRLLRRDNPSAAFQILCFQQRYREAYELAGAEYPNGFDSEWFSAAAKAAGSKSREGESRFFIAVHAARLLYELGERDRAVQQFALLANSVMHDRYAARIRQLFEVEFGLGLREQALEHAAWSLAKDSHPYALNTLFPQCADVAKQLSAYLRRIESGAAHRERLQTVWELLSAETEQAADVHRQDGQQAPAETSSRSSAAYTDLLTKAESYARGLAAENRAAWREAVGKTCLLRGDRQQAHRFLELAGEQSADAALRAGDLWAEEQDWLAAADWYRRASDLQPPHPLALFLRGKMLIKAGRDGEGRKWLDAARFAPLGSRSRHALAAGLKERGYDREAIEEWKLILATGPFRDWYVNDAAKNLGNAVSGRDDLRAAACWETMILSCLKESASFVEVHGYIQVPHLIHKARARGLWAEGRLDEALREITFSHNVWQANEGLAVEFVPLLDAAGYANAAEELFNSTYDRLLQICHDFPASAKHHNNLAWLSARCDRKLDEALKHAQRAVQLSPENVSYLDRLGEVLFHKGEGTEAIRCAEECVVRQPNNEHFRQQLNRFRQVPAKLGGF